eukprot:jgi/Botrbrau1/12812/Bobra.20_1s0003.1
MSKVQASSSALALNVGSTVYFLAGALVGTLDGIVLVFWQILDVLKEVVSVASAKVASPISKPGPATQKPSAAKENGAAGAHGAKLNGAFANGTAKGTAERDGTRVPLSRNASTAGVKSSE